MENEIINQEKNIYQIKYIHLPVEVFMNKKLDKTCCVLFSLIYNLDDVEKHCWASNQYFANILDLSTTSISTSISLLKEEGYIDQISFDGRRRILKINENYQIKHKDFNSNLNKRNNDFNGIKLPLNSLKSSNKEVLKENIIDYNNRLYLNNKEDKSSLGASQPEINSSTSIKPIKPLSEEFQLLQNKEILYKECEEIFDYWCQFGKPLHKPQKNLINPTKTLQEAFIIISKELKRLNKQEIMNAIYYYYEMLTTPDKYNLHCEDPLHLVGINDFFKFNSFLKKKQLSAKENNPAKNIKSWYWECAQGEEYLIKKYGRKPSPNQKQIQSIEDKYPNITQQFKWAWRNAMEIDKRFVLTTPEKDENAFRKASIFLKDFIKKWYDQLPETLPAHDYNEVYLSKPHTLAHNFIPAILFATEGMDDSIKITTSWLHTPKMEERLVRYYRDQGCMSDPNDDRDEEYDMEAYNL